MSESNRWAKDEYPDYRREVNDAIGFAGLGVDYFLRGKADSLVSLLQKHAEAGALGSACLDIGCGIGAMHPALIGRVRSLSGVDVSQEAIAAAQEANPMAEYRAYDGHRLPYEDGAFDMAVTICVMHHVPSAQWPAFVAEAWRVTKPGGMFAVYEHNPINPLTRLAVMRCPFDHDAELLGPRRVESLMREQGFEVVDRKFLFFVPVRSAWAKRVDKALSWLPVGAQYAVCARKPAAVDTVAP